MRLTAMLCFAAVSSLYAGAYAQPEISASDLMERLSAMAADVPPPPEVTEAEVVELEEGDPETYIFIHEAKAHPPAPARLGGDGLLTLTRKDTGESLTVRYRRRKGAYDQKALAGIGGIMRCSLTGKTSPVPTRLVELLDAVEDRFGGHGLVLLSGYRTPKLNLTVPGAARRSTHMLGWAADIRIPGHAPETVAGYAREIRAGGVGLYPDAAFVHLDAGRPRHWVMERAPRAKTAAPARAGRGSGHGAGRAP